MEVKLEKVSYKQKLKNVSMIIDSSKVTAIIEKNKSNQNNILDLIYGIKVPTLGKISIDNFDIKGTTLPKEILKIRNKIFYLSETFENQLFNINVREDIKFNIDNYNEYEVIDLLKQFKLKEEILNKNHMELSIGEKKKILLIIMALTSKKILILNNPNSNLDYKSTQTLIKLIRKLKKQNKIIILTSNNADFLLKATDRIIGIDRGNLFVDDTTYNVLCNSEIVEKLSIYMPSILEFINIVNMKKEIKLGYRSDINDLLKDIYRNVK